MNEAYIVDAVRTPSVSAAGLSGAHPADMAAHVIRTVVGRHAIDPAAIDDVILGCLDNIGSQAGDIARTAALAAGYPNRFLVSPSIANADQPSRQCISPPRA